MKIILNDLFQRCIKQEEKQKKCKHKRITTTFNKGDYKVREVCKNCGKLINYEIKK